MALSLPSSADSPSWTASDTVSSTPTVLVPGADPRIQEVAVFTTATDVVFAAYTTGATPAYVPVPASVWTTIYRRPQGGPAELVAKSRIAIKSGAGTPTVALVTS